MASQIDEYNKQIAEIDAKIKSNNDRIAYLTTVSIPDWTKAMNTSWENYNKSYAFNSAEKKAGHYQDYLTAKGKIATYTAEINTLKIQNEQLAEQRDNLEQAIVDYNKSISEAAARGISEENAVQFAELELQAKQQEIKANTDAINKQAETELQKLGIEKSKSQALYWIIGISIVLVLIIVGVLLWLKAKKKKSK